MIYLLFILAALVGSLLIAVWLGGAIHAADLADAAARDAAPAPDAGGHLSLVIDAHMHEPHGDGGAS